MKTSAAGVEARLSKRPPSAADYTFQWLKFGDTGVRSPVEACARGGHAHGAVGADRSPSPARA